MKKKNSSFQGNTPNFLRPSTQGKRQHKDMKFWNWGPTTIWHNMTCGQNCFQKSLHPNIHCILGWSDFERKKCYTFYVVPYCCWTPIKKNIKPPFFQIILLQKVLLSKRKVSANLFKFFFFQVPVIKKMAGVRHSHAGPILPFF